MLGCLLFTVVLVSGDGDQHHDHHHDHQPVHVVRVGANNARQQILAAAGGQREGATLRKVARRGRGRGFVAQGLDAPQLAPLPLAFAPQPAPLLAPQPLRFLAPQPAPFLAPQPAPLPLLAPQPFLNLRGAPLPQGPPILFQQFSPAPLPLAPQAAPTPEALTEVVAARVPVDQPTLEYGAPATLAPEVREVVQQYGAPTEQLVQVVEVRDSYLPSGEEAADISLQQQPTEAVIAVRLPVADSYAASAAEDEDEVVAVRENYGASAPARNVLRTAAVKSDLARRPVEQIAIVRSQYNPPAETGLFDYAFESANGIKQEATGSLRLVDDSEVSVMKGSYSYVGADGLLYEVAWYADETGFHPTAPHFPQPVLPDHPEVAAAVAAQLRFAAEEDALAAAASRNSASYAAPEERLGQYGRAGEELSQYNY